MKPEYITEDEWNSLQYFWSQKGDVTRYVEWPRIQHLLARDNHPLLWALQNLRNAESLMAIILQ